LAWKPLNTLPNSRGRSTATGEAAMIGISRQTILSMEMEHSTPSLKVAFKVARALGATLTELFSYELRR
jgi:DNA-binding XRE family transcriptional regulator